MNVDCPLSLTQRRAAHGCLNEYLNGLKDSASRLSPPAGRAEFFELMAKLRREKQIVVNDRELAMIEYAIQIAITEIQDWEFPIRLGRSKQEILDAFRE